MISNLMEKRDKVNKVLEKEGLLYRAGLIDNKIALIKKKGTQLLIENLQKTTKNYKKVKKYGRKTKVKIV